MDEENALLVLDGSDGRELPRGAGLTHGSEAGRGEKGKTM